MEGAPELEERLGGASCGVYSTETETLGARFEDHPNPHGNLMNPRGNLPWPEGEVGESGPLRSPGRGQRH